MSHFRPIAPALALGVMLACQAPAIAQQDRDMDLSADHISEDANTHTLTANGHVTLVYQDVHVLADTLTLDTETRQGRVEGHVHAQGPDFELNAASADFDLVNSNATLNEFRGHWRDRAQFAGDQLELGPHVFLLKDAFITPCMHPEPDLTLTAHAIRFYPKSSQMNLSAEGVGIQVLGTTVLALPFFTTTVGEHKQAWNANFFPAFGFNAYEGFLTSTRLDFSFGQFSRGTIPIIFSSERGWSSGFDHILNLGPGELSNSARLETPWAANRGGLRVLNAYRFPGPLGGRWELQANYREDMNGQPVNRLPEIAWLPPVQDLFGVVHVQSELRAGNLYEETSEAQSWRFRAATPFNTPNWTPLPWYQTWFNATPFYQRYTDSDYGGFQADWTQRQTPLPGLALTETGELIRVFGDTPFLFDRMYDAERLRLSADRDWSPRVSTSAMVSWSRINQQGPFSIEDLMLSGTYRWNCFGFTLAFHPLVLGVETHFQLLNF